MRRSLPTLLLTRLTAGLLLISLAACSPGGGSGTPASVPLAAPQALSYPTNPAVYTKGAAITPNVPSHGGGAVSGYTISPTLPAGLTLDTVSGSLTGTPGAVAPTASYTVTATNASGGTTALLALTVNDVPPAHLAYGTPAATYTVGTAITANPVTQDGGVVTGYSVAPSLPAGLTFSSLSGTITGTPSATSALSIYTVTATNSGGSTTANLSIAVNAAPVAPAFITQPANLSLTAGQNGQFVVAVSGTPTPTLDWQTSLNGGAWSSLGVTSPVLSLQSATLADSGRVYRVVASSTAGTVTSNSATLTVTAAPVAPSFTTQPANLSLTAGQNGQFVVAVGGTPTPTLDWQTSLSGGAWSSLGVTSPVLSVQGVTLADSGRQYRVVASSSAGTVTSNSASLTVSAAPVAPAFTTQPANLSLTAGQNGQFVVAVIGTPTPTLDWQTSLNGGAWSSLGVTSPVLSVQSATLADSGRQYRVVASSSAGTVTSNSATLTVTAAPVAPAFTTQPANATITEGQNAQFLVAVSGIPAPTLQWQTSINQGSWSSMGVTSPVLAVLGATLADSGRLYRVLASNSAGTVTSNSGTLTVNAAPVAPVFTTQPVNATIIEGQNAQFVVAVSGVPAPTLQWQVSTSNGSTWGDVAGSTGTVLDVLGATLAQSGRQFRAVATSTSGSLASQAAVLTVHAAQGAKAFGTAALIEAGPTPAARSQIAFAPNGDALAVWMQQSDGVFFHIWANHYTAATNTWGTETIIGNGATDAWDPKIAVDPQGNALVVWYQDGDPTGAGRNDIWSNYYTAGAGWGLAQLVETDNAGPALNPQVAMDANGVGMAVWLQSDGTASQIRSNRFTAGAWGTVTLLEVVAPGASRDPQIAIDANGNALAVWSRYDGVSENIWANRYTAGVGWGAASLIETDNAGPATAPKVAFDAAGNALAVWQQSDGLRRNIWSNRYTAGVGWGTAELIEWNNAADANLPQIAVDGSGTAVAVWEQNGSFGSPTRIWSNRYTPGSGWGGFPSLIQTDISGGSTANGATPQIALDASGNAIAVWVQPDGASDNTPDIWVNRYTVGSGWGTTANLGQIRINIPGAAGASASQPHIAIDANGNALVVWTQSNGVNDGIWANRYQ